MIRKIKQLLIVGKLNQLVAWADDGSLWLYDHKPDNMLEWMWWRLPDLPDTNSAVRAYYEAEVSE